MTQNGVDLSDMPNSAPQEPVETTTAFIIAQSPDGAWVVISDPSVPLSLVRPPTADDIYAGCAVVQKDISAQVTAAHTQRAMLQLTQAMQQKAQTDNIAQRLGNLRP